MTTCYYERLTLVPGPDLTLAGLRPTRVCRGVCGVCVCMYTGLSIGSIAQEVSHLNKPCWLFAAAVGHVAFGVIAVVACVATFVANLRLCFRCVVELFRRRS